MKWALARLNQLRWSTAFLLGTLVDGVLIDAFGVTAVYLVDAATVLPALVLFLGVASTARRENAEPIALGSIRTGLRFARSRQELMGTYLVDIVATFFAMPQVGSCSRAARTISRAHRVVSLETGRSTGRVRVKPGVVCVNFDAGLECCCCVGSGSGSAQ